MSTSLERCLADALDGAATILVAAASADDARWTPLRAAAPNARELEVNALDALEGLSRHDVVIAVALVGAGLETALARLRDVVSPVVLSVEFDEPDSAALRALGFDRIYRPASPGEPWLHGHRIDTYKRTPDWLNSRFWANPDRWDAERW